VNRRCLWPAIAQTDLDQNVARCRFGVFDKHVEISVFIEDAGVNQLVFRSVAAAPPIGFDEVTIGICILRVFIEIFHVGVGRSAIEVIVIFLDVLPVIALAIGQAEQSLLEDRVLAVPQGDSKTEPLVLVADPGEAILTPVISA